VLREHDGIPAGLGRASQVDVGRAQTRKSGRGAAFARMSDDCAINHTGIFATVRFDKNQSYCED
jgi:hypothetical protein